ncbi:MAG: magnesium transporter CorA family protein [Chloroflexota bacterium]
MTPEAATAEKPEVAGTAPRVPGRLFDADGDDRDVTVTLELVEKIDERQTLWVDLTDPDDATVDAVAALWGLSPVTVQKVRAGAESPHVTAFDSYLHLFVTTVEVDDDAERTARLAIIVGPNVVITVHAESLAFLDAYQDHLRGDTAIGLIDGPAFVAVLLDWLLSGYFHAVERLEEEADQLDHRALDPRSEQDLLADLVRLRRRISGLRRALTPHREVFAALARPQLTGLGDPDDEPQFRALADRLERAIAAVETARELVLGSFDVHMSRTAQRTNDVMKLLTLVTVILLPSSVIAGIMGMNFRVEFFDQSTWFWVVIGAMVLIAGATLVLARLRRWI